MIARQVVLLTIRSPNLYFFRPLYPERHLNQHEAIGNTYLSHDFRVVVKEKL